jgi:DNA mismatch endonuclease (patch repair protein)
MDKLTRVRRSENMRRIRSKDTNPEMIVRRIAHRLGFRYRLHSSKLPGKPDLVFSSRRKAIFVHGCFWHQHSRCPAGRVPSSQKSYWTEKLARNVSRDREHVLNLRKAGWKTLILWECELSDQYKVAKRLTTFLR